MTTALLVALTGGIGAGKSTVARMLADRGAWVIDADATSRRVVDPQDRQGRAILAKIAKLLGPEALQPDGALDRERVAALIFSEDELRRRYNDIVHPAIMSATAAEIEAYRSRTGVVVHEIPLLTIDSPSLPWTYDLIVTVEADPEERIRRLQLARGYAPEHAAARVNAQGLEAPRVAIADVILRTDGTIEETKRQVDELWWRLH